MVFCYHHNINLIKEKSIVGKYLWKCAFKGISLFCTVILCCGIFSMKVSAGPDGVVPLTQNHLYNQINEKNQENVSKLRQKFLQEKNGKFLFPRALDNLIKSTKVFLATVNDPIERNKIECLIGIMFLDNDCLALNVNSLKTFFGNCKSAINGNLQRLGYNSKSIRCASEECKKYYAEFCKHFGRDVDSSTYRHWTFRKKSLLSTELPVPPALRHSPEKLGIPASHMRPFCPQDIRLSSVLPNNQLFTFANIKLSQLSAKPLDVSIPSTSLVLTLGLRNNNNNTTTNTSNNSVLTSTSVDSANANQKG